jgi:RNase P/RNase MRP subunit p29
MVVVDNIIESFIGKNIYVVKGNPSYVGLSGRVLDDKKHSFVIEHNNDKKIVLKKNTVFVINNKIINGNKLLKRIVDRIKIRR